MNPEELAELGVQVHTIKGYGDTAVAEMAFALMWDAARKTAAMDGGIREGGWPRTEGMQLTGKTVGLVGFGGIAAEMARLCAGIGMRVLAWNRTPRTPPRRGVRAAGARCWRKARWCRCTSRSTTRRAASSPATASGRCAAAPCW